MGTPQGDTALLATDLAQQLLSSTTLARLAYVWTDSTPRVVPIWFHWTGEEVVFGSPATAPKVRVLATNPSVAISIDTEEHPARVLLIRGRATVEVQDGVTDEYAAAARRYMGADGGAQWVAGVDQPGMRMARIGVRPQWVGLLDFETRLPSALGGVLD